MSALSPPLASAAAPHVAATAPAVHPTYRPDIDGLRAVAVLAVVAYHAFPAKVRGGFIGVDVFFVISGYLISTILLGNLQRERFGFVDFYVRRIRRIFPALLVVLAATFAFGWWSLMADEYLELGKHVAAGAGFVSNLVLWSESGYFDAAAEAKPLLHLWSLGIEEQFYIVWPLLLWAAWRLRWNTLAVIAAAAAASFAWNLRTMHADPVADFYSPASRVWELALGAALAHASLFEPRILARATDRQRDAQSLAGAALLLAGGLTATATSAFPGWLALAPTLGAVLLIAAGPRAWVNRHVLSHRVMVGFGLISFPLYLWHWPILSYIRIVAAERPGRLVRVVAIAAAVLLAWATYRWVERPVRRRGGTRALPLALVAAMTVTGVVGFAAFRDGGFEFRAVASVGIVNAGDTGHEAFYRYPYQHFTLCTPPAVRRQAEVWKGAIRCFQSRPGPIDVAIVGDSHAEQLFIGLADALPGANVASYVRSALPTIDNPRFETIWRTVLDDPHITTVVLTAWWTLRFEELPGGTTAAAALAATVRPLVAAGKTVYLTDDTPNFSFSPLLCKYGSSLLRKHRCDEEAAFYGRQLDAYRQILEDTARLDPHVHLLRTSRYFCDAAQCSMARAGVLWFRDSDHLSVPGSQYVGRRLVEDYPELRDLGRRAGP